MRYPSQKERFSGLHEVTAYPAGNPQQPNRSVNAQAYERIVEEESGNSQNYVTILGRIDSSIVFPLMQISAAWPARRISSTLIGLEVYNTDLDSQESAIRIEVPYSAIGTSLRSLERLYVSQILSKANIDLTALPSDGNPEKRVLWKSSELTGANPGRKATGVIQRVSDWWANLLVNFFGYEKRPVVISRRIEGRPILEVSLRADPILLPDIATRSFLWLTLALLATLFMIYIWARAIIRLQTITQAAYKMTASHKLEGGLDSYSKRKDEIGILARTFNVLLKRSRSRNARIGERLKRDEQERKEEIKLAHENVKARQSVLDAIGHEIRSPLQSLISKIPEESDLRHDVDRMTRAVDALYEATSIEAGFKNGKYVVKVSDLGRFLARLSANNSEQGHKVCYDGPNSGVDAVFDAIALDAALGHVLSNAIRHRTPNTDIHISLVRDGNGVTIEIFNFGLHIPHDQLERIFNLGVSSAVSSDNRGLGLFAARTYMLGMRGTIHAENRSEGVVFVVTLPSKL